MPHTQLLTSASTRHADWPEFPSSARDAIHPTLSGTRILTSNREEAVGFSCCRRTSGTGGCVIAGTVRKEPCTSPCGTGGRRDTLWLRTWSSIPPEEVRSTYIRAACCSSSNNMQAGRQKSRHRTVLYSTAQHSTAQHSRVHTYLGTYIHDGTAHHRTSSQHAHDNVLRAAAATAAAAASKTAAAAAAGTIPAARRLPAPRS